LLKLKSEIRFFDFRVTCRCLHLLSDNLLFWDSALTDDNRKIVILKSPTIIEMLQY